MLESVAIFLPETVRLQLEV